MSEAYTLLDAVYAAARWGGYLAAFLVLGAGGYAPFLFRHRTRLDATDPDLEGEVARRASAIGLWASLLLVVMTACRLYLQARTLIEPGEPVTLDVIQSVLRTAWGKGWERQAVMAVLAAVAFAGTRRGFHTAWLFATAAGGGIGVAAGMTGHAATELSGPGGSLIDAAHVWAGGTWLGGLAVMLIAALAACRRLPEERHRSVIRAVVADFSRRATIFAPLTIGLGIWLAIRYLGWGWPFHLSETGYGWALVAKLITLLIVGLLGAYHWRQVNPRPGAVFDEPAFRRTAKLELVFGSLLLAATAVLVALPLPGEH